MERTLLFLHIPKTGGSTFRHHMKKVYGPDDVFFQYEKEDQDVHLREAFASRAPAICGHLNWFVVQNSGGLQERPFLFTMIRRPQDQVISHFLHRRRGHSWKNRTELFTDFREFLSEAWSRNWQAAFLSGLDKENYLTPSPDELSGMAMANLKKIDLVASTDQLDKAVVFLRRELGWPRIKLEDRNVNKEAHIAETLHAEFDTRLKELNKADHALYRYAKSKMNSKWKKLPLWKRF